MKILYWTHLFYPYIGGMEVSAVRLLPLLQKRGFDITVLCCDWDGIIERESVLFGMKVVRIPMLRALASKNLIEIKRAKQQIRQLQEDFRPDLNHCNLGTPAMMFFNEQPGSTPTIITLHESLIGVRGLSSATDTLLAKAFAHAVHVTGVSKSAIDDAAIAFPDIAKKSSIIYHGIETEGLEPSVVPIHPPTLLSVARLVEGKGIDIAIDAFAEVYRSVSECRLIIAGDGPDRAALQERARALGLEEVIQFHGWVAPEAISELINKCSIVVIPSTMDEGFCQVAIEAARMGRPSVGTQAGGLAEAIGDGESGLLVPKNDSSALSAAIIKLLSNTDLLQSLGTRARLRCSKIFGIETTVVQYAQLYERVIKESRAGVV